MKWEKVREYYPDVWVLVEALQAHTTEDKFRVVEEWSVIEQSADFYEAFDFYKQLHRDMPQRELYVVHTINEEVIIKERFWVGIRPKYAL